MAYWLLKSDPDDYGFDDLEREGRAVWDGVSNNLALQHLRKVRKGDRVLFYHSGADKAIVGIAEAISDAYPDSKAKDGKLVVFDLKPVQRIAKPVSLASIKADPKFATFELVRMSRLSVMPVPAPVWTRLLQMAGDA